MTPRFKPGRVVATPGALEALARSGRAPDTLLDRHVSGDWGDVGLDDAHANDQALVDGERLLSSYILPDGPVVWVITEAVGDDGVRASTCVLLPSEY